MTLNHFRVACIAATLLFFSSCNQDDQNDDAPAPQPEAKSAMHIKIEHVWGADEHHFHVGDTYTHPETEEEVKVNTLNYYISNIKLYQQDGTEWTEDESYHLVMVEPGHAGMTAELNLEVPQGNYTSIKYMIGVDSLRNVSGAQTGALDQAIGGMFWNWNSGYKFVKVEGESSSAVATQGQFTYHLGGFSGVNNAIQELEFDFQGAVLEVMPEANPSIHLKLDPSQLWKNGTSIETMSTVHMPGDMAVMLAGNFASGFRFDHIHN